MRGLIYANHFLVAWDWRHYLWATLLAIIAVAIASYVPRRASLLSPVSTLRGNERIDSQLNGHAAATVNGCDVLLEKPPGRPTLKL